MADITGIFGGAFAGQKQQEPLPAEQQLQQKIIEAGLEAPDQIFIDGNIHRFRSGSKGKASGDKTGWYVAFNDGVPAGRFGCWRLGIEQTFRADVGRKLTHVEEMAHTKRMAEAKEKRDAEREKLRSAVSDTVSQIWETCTAAQPSHPYLMKKGIKPNGSRVTGDGRLVVPLYDAGGNLSSLQYIDSDGGKLYHQGGKTGGCYWQVGSHDEGVIYIAEGFATAATIHESVGSACAVAYSASNLPHVTKALRERYGEQQSIVIVADNDASGVGLKHADQASALYGARVIIPPELGDANDFAQSGHDLRELLTPKNDGWLIPADEFSAQPAPLTWLLKGWIPTTGLMMIHGPSGGGKTFLVLDWLLSIAGGMNERMGHKVRPGTVVYLAGEGHHGLRGRIAAWKQHNSVASLDMFLSREGCDLNTAEGFRRVVDSIRATGKAPAAIAVDTLHRFLNGDENSAQDAKTMLDACAALTNEFGCVVILVHHTGVNELAQHRARGSSAWRGALDIEVSVVPPAEDGNTIEIIQRKNKDAELERDIFCQLESIEINGWIDEDGEPVSSAILNQVYESDKKQENKKEDSKLQKHKKIIERAYWYGGAEMRNEAPYFSKSALIDMLENDGISSGTAKNYAKASYDRGPICYLINAEIIKPCDHGWIILDDVMASILMIAQAKK